MRPIRFLLRWLLVGAGGCLPLAAVAEPVDFDVPAQAADRALLAISRQAKIEILFFSDALHAVNSTAVTGRHEPKDALEQLLQGTGFVARRNWLGKFVIAAAPPPPGILRGKILAADGHPARGIRVNLREARQTARTNDQGEFDFAAVPPGTYHLVAGGGGYPTTMIATDVRVESNRVVALEPQTIRTGTELMRLDPVVVEGRSDHARRFADDPLSTMTQTAAGNLDLPRTRNDALPYTIFNREQISRSGVVNLNDFLQRNVLDSNAVTRPPEQTPGDDRNLESFRAGSSNLKLRGYGADETVVLVNGRRLPEALISGPNPQSQTPDVNFIPLSLVERVEVLPIAASALYSGNAVGGVINIVLRPDVDATEVTTTYTNALGGFDAPQSTVSLQHGQSLLGGALRLRFNATFTRTDPVTEAELGYIQANLRHRGGLVDGLHRATPNVASADGFPLFGAGTASFTSVAPGDAGNAGLAAFARRAGVRSTALSASPGGQGNSPDSRDFPYGREQRGHSYFGSVTYDVRPWLQLGFDGILTSNVLHRGYAIFPGNLSLRADSPLNPFGKEVNVTLNETVPQLGENYSEARTDFSSAVLGLLLQLPRDWRISADAQYGHNLTRYRGLAGVDGERWQKLVDDGLYNPLRDTQVFGPPREFYDRALIYYGGRGRFVTLGNYDTLDAALRISNRSLSLPTGSAALNFGGDYRRNHLQSFANEQRYGDGSLVADPDQWSARTVQRLSAFAELQAPLVPARWLPRLVRGIDLDVAARYVAAASAQETNVAPTGGLKIDLAGGFTLRGTIATSNRFPPPVLNRRVQAPENTGAGGGEVSLGSVADPQRDNARYSVASSEEINPNLHLEAAVSRSIGLVFQRGKIHQLRAAIDFMNTEKSGELHFLDLQETVDLENVFPGRVERAPLAPGDTHNVGLITSVLTGNVNLAWRHSRSWSTSLDYAWTECLGGRFQAYARWIYFERYDVQLLPNSPVVNELTHPDRTNNPELIRHRLNFGGEWSNAAYGLGIDGHYFHSRVLPVNDWADQGRDRIKPQWQFDTFLQADLARWFWVKTGKSGDNSRFGLRAQVRVNNVFDAPPPKYVNDPSQTGVQVYGDWRGRVYSVSLTATF